MSRVLTCDEGDYDAQTGTCSAPYYAEQQTAFLPDLTPAEGTELAVAMLIPIAIGAGIRWARQVFKE